MFALAADGSLLGVNNPIKFIYKITDAFYAAKVSTVINPAYTSSYLSALVVRPDNSFVVAGAGDTNNNDSEIFLFSTTPEGKTLMP